MKHLKTFEAYVGPIFPNSKFTQEDMDELMPDWSIDK